MALKEIQDLLEGPIWILWEIPDFFKIWQKSHGSFCNSNFSALRFCLLFAYKNMRQRQRSDLQACRKRGTTVQQWYCVKAVSSPPKTKPRCAAGFHHCHHCQGQGWRKNAAVSMGFFAKVLIYAPRSSVSTKSRSSQRRTWQTRSKAAKSTNSPLKVEGQRRLYPICYSLDVGRLNAQTSQPEVLIGSMAIPRFSKSNIRFKLPTFVKLQAHESLSTFNNTHIMYVSYL